MRVIILGASRFGAAIAERLIEADHEVVLIDKDRDRLQKLAETVDCGMVEGDGTLPSVLRDVFRDEDDAFIAVTNASDDNILASVVARSVGFGRVIPQITSMELMDVCEELDLTEAINPHATVAESICTGLEDRTEVDTDATLHNELALKRVSVPEAMVGKRVADVDLPEGTRPIAIIRDETEHFAEADRELKLNDFLLIVAERDGLDAAVAAFES